MYGGRPGLKFNLGLATPISAIFGCWWALPANLVPVVQKSWHVELRDGMAVGGVTEQKGSLSTEEEPAEQVRCYIKHSGCLHPL